VHFANFPTTAGVRRTATTPDIDRGAKKLLFFVHGFNVSFVEAVVRGAQLAHDLEFDGDLLVYSWASMGAVLSYGRGT
jgi:esterase/lipase superfamily enzyme